MVIFRGLNKNGHAYSFSFTNGLIDFCALTIPYIYPDESLLSADIATISNMRTKPNILIVDDDPVIAYLNKELIEKEGFQSTVCLNAFDALCSTLQLF